MLCKTPHIQVRKTGSIGYFFSSDFLKRVEQNESIFAKKLTFEDYSNYLEFYKRNKSINRPWLEWLKTFTVTKFPCGKCMACKYEHYLEWSARCWLEAKQYDSNMFVTLTYNDKHLPQCGVTKTEITRFMRDLRQYYSRKRNHNGIRFFASGEYGELDNRPHYHILLFNCLPFGDEIEHSKNELGQSLYTSKILDSVWKKGNCKIGSLTRQSASYVARYNFKNTKLKLCQPLNLPFIHMSSNPGIASNHFYENIDQIIATDMITLTGNKTIKLPRYFNRKLKEHLGDERYQTEIAQPRAERAKSFIENEMAKTGLSEEELQQKHIDCIEKEVQQLKYKRTTNKFKEHN